MCLAQGHNAMKLVSGEARSHSPYVSSQASLAQGLCAGQLLFAVLQTPLYRTTYL